MLAHGRATRVKVYLEVRMSYIKADNILPRELVEMIQQYVEGENIYIPRKLENRRSWGTKTGIRQEIAQRNGLLYRDYLEGMSTALLAERYCLSVKSVQRIILEEKRKIQEI